MFTGIVESVCEVCALGVPPAGRGIQVSVALGPLADGIKAGDSVAINGTCLTVASLYGDRACFDVSPETLHRTTLGGLQVGDGVNVERALQVGQRLGGHFVQGHIDGQATLRSVTRQGDFWTLSFTLDTALAKQLLLKGSVAVDGVSLTVSQLDNRGFSVAIIPETAERTTLCTKKPGSAFNIEVDMLVKAVQQTCRVWMEDRSGLTAETLKEAGF